MKNSFVIRVMFYSSDSTTLNDLSQIVFQSTAHPTDSGGGHNELKKQEKS